MTFIEHLSIVEDTRSATN